MYEVLVQALDGVVDADRTLFQDCQRRARVADDETGRVLGCRFAENLNNPADPVTIAHHTLVGS